MAKKKKKKKKTQVVQMTPKKYIMTKANKLPFGPCYVNSDWQTAGLAVIMITREQPSGKFIIGLYLVDVFCLGLKSTFFRFGMDADELEDFKEEIYDQRGQVAEDTYPIFLQNIIYGAIEYAEDLGLEVRDKDFNITEYILDAADDIEFIEIEFGKDGKPYYFSGPNDDVDWVISRLNDSVGPDGYHYTLGGGLF